MDPQGKKKKNLALEIRGRADGAGERDFLVQRKKSLLSRHCQARGGFESFWRKTQIKTRIRGEKKSEVRRGSKKNTL